MKKRPDYGNTTPGDLARALMTGHQKKARHQKSGSGRSNALKEFEAENRKLKQFLSKNWQGQLHAGRCQQV